MKFSLKSSSSSGRLGIITNVARLPDFEMETPHALMYTRSGTVPHLTPDVIQMIKNQNLALHIPISSMIHIQDRVKLQKSNIAKYIGMSEYLTYCTFIDSAQKRVEGFHEKNSIPFFSRHGKKNLTAENYMNIMETFKPDMFLLLADGDTQMGSSQKRTLKSFNCSMNMYTKCMELYKKSDELKESSIIAALEGGFDLNLRDQFSEVIGKSPVFAVVIDGFHNCSEKTMDIEYKDIKPAIEASLKHIPSNKLRIIHGSWNPSVMLDLIKNGIDLFDSSYPFIVTEQKNALIFPNDDKLLNNYHITTKNGINGSKENDIKSSDQIISDTNHVPMTGSPSKIPKLISNSPYFMSMTDTRHAVDFSPILPNCSCHTCKHHTKAYIHHLVNVKELLGPTLLMIHNMHHFFQFLSLIRKSLSIGTFDQLKDNFETWINKTKDNLH